MHAAVSENASDNLPGIGVPPAVDLTGVGQTGVGQTGVGQTGVGQTGVGQTGADPTAAPATPAAAEAAPHASAAAEAAPHASATAAAPAAGPELLQLLTPTGERVPNPVLDPWVADVTGDTLLALYEDLVVVRRIDAEGMALQRQGQLALWPPLLGQEAAQIGSARALRADDFVFPSYREHGVAYCRGVATTDVLRMWRGVANSGWNPYDVGMATPAIIIGAQTLHATGYALGCAKDGADSVTVAYFGDGATSQGDVNEAMVFAASFQAPVVFFCQNNHWAISEPVGLQAHRAIADRAPGFGIPSLRVDGNDVLAVMAATRLAADRARTGGGPTFIEAVTYRMGPHTTSDDPTRYVDPAERADWARKDPIARVEALLEREGLLTDEARAAVAQAADAEAGRLRAGLLTLPDPDPLSVFDHVFTAPTSWLERQRGQYAAYLEMFDDPADAGGHGDTAGDTAGDSAGGAR